MSLYFVIIKTQEDRIMRITFLTLFVLTISLFLMITKYKLILGKIMR